MMSANDTTPAARTSRFHWLTAERVRGYSILFITLAVCGALVHFATSRAGLDARGKPIGYDFMSFWCASALTLQGEPAAAYDPARILAMSQTAISANRATFIFSYPPIFHLLVAPLALLPYFAAYGVWCVLTFLAYLAALRRCAPSALTPWAAAAFPGVFLNAMQGQTGCLFTALLGGAVWCLDRRPRLAGVLIGLMSFKPHLGVLVPFALLCGRRWQALIAAAVTALTLAAASVAVFGPGVWVAFVHNLPFAAEVLDRGALPLHKMPSVFASLRLLGAPSTLALGLHVALALAVAAIVGWSWWRSVSLPLAAATLAVGSLLMSPHLNDHDLVLLALPIALLAWDGHQRGWRVGDRELLALAWVCPLIVAPVAYQLRVQLAPLILSAILAIGVRRSLHA